jgi:hypothetical protein
MAQDVAYESVAGSPIFTGGCVSNNNFEYASIRLLGFLPSQVSNNTFYTGLIRVGSTSGSNALYSANISSNRALLPLGANTCFIKLEGYVYQSVFQNNSCFNTFTYCINNNGASTGDNGGNVFIGNTVTNAGTSGVAHTKHYQSQYYNNTNQDVPVSVTLSGSTSAPIDYNSYVGRTWLTVQTATATPTISNITNVPADGTFLTIMSGANGGGGTTTIANTANVALKGGVNAVMPIYGTISFIARAATFFEISRNF